MDSTTATIHQNNAHCRSVRNNCLQNFFVANYSNHFFMQQHCRTFEYLIDPKAIAREEQEYTYQKKQRHNNKKDKTNNKSRKPANRFIDKTRIRVMGGTGGKGSLSSEHLLSKKSTVSGSTKLRPDGGHGGNGGCVYIVANQKHHSNSLRTSTSHFAADCGTNGRNRCQNGRNGKNLIIYVPPGVVVKQILDSDTDNMGYNPNDSDYEYHKSYTKEYKEYHDVVVDDNNNDDDRSDDDDDDSDGGIEYFEMTEEEVNNEDYSTNTIAAKSSKSNNSAKNDENDDSDDDEHDTNNSYDENDDDEVDDINSTSQRQTVVLADLDRHGSHVMVARGGKGGIGSMVYSSRHGPLPDTRILVQKAQPTTGEIVHLELELKSIADVGLVGYPNAGKSSLLRSISLAQPEVAPYPFTTLHPILGVVQYQDGYTVRVADIPGIIDGASTGRGKGMDFLRHIERTNVLLYIVDAACTPIERRKRYETTTDDPTNQNNHATIIPTIVRYNDPIEDLFVLAKELELYNGGSGSLLNRPALIVANKIDLLPNRDIMDQVLYELTQAGTQIGIQFDTQLGAMGISAGVTGEGLQQLTKELRTIVSRSKTMDNQPNEATPNNDPNEEVCSTFG